MSTLSGWWLTYLSEKYEFVNWDDYSQYFWENNPVMFQTTNQVPWINELHQKQLPSPGLQGSPRLLQPETGRRLRSHGAAQAQAPRKLRDRDLLQLPGVDHAGAEDGKVSFQFLQEATDPRHQGAAG